MIVLGLESSCDETAVGIVTDDRRILSNQIATQMEEHKPYGGVVPEIAARAHLEHIDPLIRLALDEAKLDLSSIDGVAASGRVWSFGPAFDLPLFDAGRRAANADAARARYDEALAAYKGTVRRAVREVEQSLSRLSSAAEREAEAHEATLRYDETFAAAEKRWQAGIGSQLELEEVRRLAVAARSQHVGVQYDGIAAWIGLYRAIGGGWSPDAQRISKN